jgi:hypothetical protein
MRAMALLCLAAFMAAASLAFSLVALFGIFKGELSPWTLVFAIPNTVSSIFAGCWRPAQ